MLPTSSHAEPTSDTVSPAALARRGPAVSASLMPAWSHTPRSSSAATNETRACYRLGQPMRHGLVAFSLLLPLSACGVREVTYRPNAPTGHSVVLVTLDGVRWQELFAGQDPLLDREGAPVFTRFWAELAPLGRVYGDPRVGDEMR